MSGCSSSELTVVFDMRLVEAARATFVALAETLTTPLITCDAHLASASGHTAQIELFAAS